MFTCILLYIETLIKVKDQTSASPLSAFNTHCFIYILNQLSEVISVKTMITKSVLRNYYCST